MRRLLTSKRLAAALGAVIVILVTTIGWTVAQLVSETRLRATERSERDWAVVQLEFETLRMADAHTHYRFERNQDALDELLLRADIVESRLSLFREGIVADALAGRPDIKDLVFTIRITLLDVGMVETSDDAEAIAALGRSIEALRAKAYDASVALLLDSNRSLAALEVRLRSLWYWIALPLTALILVGGFLVVLLTGAVRRESQRREEATRARREALAAEQMLSNAMSAMSDGLLIAKADGRIVTANRRVDELMPATIRRPFAGRQIQLLRDQLLAEAVVDIRTSAADTGAEIDPLDPQHLDRDHELHLAGDQWLWISRRTTADGGMVFVMSDITPLKRRERDLATAMHAAEAASRAKTEFLANMSHEFKTPLNAVIGFTDMVMQGAAGPLNDRQREYLGHVRDGGNRLLSLIDDILEMVRADRDGLKAASLDLDRLVAGAVTDAERAAREADVTLARLELDLPVHSAIRGDRRLLRRAIDALLSNAIKFTPTGGHITVSLRNTTLPHPEGSPIAGVEVSIADTGIGIAPEQIERVQQPFVQIDSSLARRYEGAGLGLPLARRFVEAHDGQLSLNSAPGLGTEARIWLPLASAEPEAASATRLRIAAR
ncbi:ATP-binding protein [Tistrella mobilis]|uniref:sensor histidine kinase n=1 Tax=Tistrella mobilis TaxID=171437 RepID=UPI003556C0CD